MKKINKKGFTLVELLSVIVILSVVVLIATNAVIPAMNSAKKQVLSEEANIIIPIAETIYTQKGYSGTKCISYEEIKNSNLLEKSDPNYTGSVKINVDENGSKTTQIWLSNGTYAISGAYYSVSPDSVMTSAEDASTVCGAN